MKSKSHPDGVTDLSSTTNILLFAMRNTKQFIKDEWKKVAKDARYEYNETYDACDTYNTHDGKYNEYDFIGEYHFYDELFDLPKTAASRIALIDGSIDESKYYMFGQFAYDIWVTLKIPSQPFMTCY